MSWLTLSSLVCSWPAIAAEGRSKSRLARTMAPAARRQQRPANAMYHVGLATRAALVLLAASLIRIVLATSRERSRVFPVAVGSLILGLRWMLVLG